MASVGEPISQVISRPTSSEDEIHQIDTSDYKQRAVEEEEEEEQEEEENDYATDKQIEAGGLSKGDPNNSVERLELIIIGTKTGQDGLSDEILNISKQLLSMKIFNLDQSENFAFNYGE